jgi:hypothetical protein
VSIIQVRRFPSTITLVSTILRLAMYIWLYDCEKPSEVRLYGMIVMKKLTSGLDYTESHH